jgi:sulfur relay (sulfurtransferase) complex TusBCD TusD component (DsrE family)
MLRNHARTGTDVKVCSTRTQRCGIATTGMIREAPVAGMNDLAEWIGSSEKVLSL